MKKLFMVLLTLGLVSGILAGCGAGKNESQNAEAPAENAAEVSNEETQPTDNAAEEGTPTNQNEPAQVAVTPTEPDEHTTCSMCDMIVYPHDHEMGKFTGQVVTADGKHLFTDDVGCLMNQIRTLEETPQAAWVRDYNSLEWIPVKTAIPVRASIETPMKMGFALFGTEDAANKYVTENPMLAPVISTMDDVDKIAEERYKAKMAKMKESQEKAAGKMDSNMNGEMNGQMNHN